MKTFKRYLSILFLAFLASCSNDDDAVPVKATVEDPYPESIVQHRFDGTITEFDNGFGAVTTINMELEADRSVKIFESKNGVVLEGTGTWSYSGNIFRCSYTLENGVKYTIQGLLSTNEGYNIIGYRGKNDETTGEGKVEMLIV